MLKEIALIHNELRGDILDAMRKCFIACRQSDLEPLQLVELKRCLLNVLIYLVQLGYVFPTLNAIDEMIQNLDLALIRQFLLKVKEEIFIYYKNRL